MDEKELAAFTAVVDAAQAYVLLRCTVLDTTPERADLLPALLLATEGKEHYAAKQTNAESGVYSCILTGSARKLGNILGAIATKEGEVMSVLLVALTRTA